MAGENVFLSYSRQQLYFAESLALNLMKANIPIWFDIQKLKPGCIWQEEINKGLDSSSSMILVASQTSFNSVYVRKEYLHALEKGQTVYVCIYEAVELPPELSDMPVIDFRADFKDGIQRLIHMLRTGAVIRDPVPKPNRLGLQTRMSRSIWIVAVTAFITAVLAPVAALVGTVYLATQTTISPFILVTLLVLSGWLVLTFWRFLHHRADYENLRLLVILPFLVAAGAFLVTLLNLAAVIDRLVSVKGYYLATGPSDLATAIALFLPALFFIVLTGYAFLFGMYRSGDVLRWLHISRVPTGFRMRVGSQTMELIKAARRQQGLSGQPVTFELHYDPLDEPMAKIARKAMYRYGHRLPPSENPSPDAHVAILTNTTPTDLVNKWIDSYGGRLLCIVGTPVHIPSEANRLTAYQWVDCRTFMKERMDTLAYSLRGEEAGNLMYSLNTVPENIEQLRTPARVAAYAHMLRSFAAAHISIAIFNLLIILGTLKGYPIPVWQVGVGIALGLVQFWFVQRYFSRTATLLQILIVFAIIETATLIFQIGFGAAALMQGFSLYIVYQTVAAFLFWTILCFTALRRWSPAKPPPRVDRFKTRLPRHSLRRIWLMSGVYVTANLLISLVSFDVARSALSTTPQLNPANQDIEGFTAGQGYESAADHFKVAFPSPPIKSSMVGQSFTNHVPVSVTVYLVNDGSRSFQVTVNDYSGEFSNTVSEADRLNLFGLVRKNLAQLVSGTETSRADIQIGNFPGERFSIEAGVMIIKGQQVMMDRNLYLIVVTLPVANSEATAGDEFMNSFQLIQDK